MNDKPDGKPDFGDYARDYFNAVANLVGGPDKLADALKRLPRMRSRMDTFKLLHFSQGRSASQAAGEWFRKHLGPALNAEAGEPAAEPKVKLPAYRYRYCGPLTIAVRDKGRDAAGRPTFMGYVETADGRRAHFQNVKTNADSTKPGHDDTADVAAMVAVSVVPATHRHGDADLAAAIEQHRGTPIRREP